MNVFTLFETEDVESIKLAIQVVKTLNKEKEFKTYFNVSIGSYEKVFDNYVKHTYNQPFNYFMNLSHRATLDNKGELINKTLYTRFDSIKIGCVLLGNNFTSFYFNNGGINVDLSEHYQLFSILCYKNTSTNKMTTNEIVELINIYFNEHI